MSIHTGNADGWFQRFHQSPESTVRLVCFPHAGGSASYYYSLSQLLTPEVEVVAVQYPGRQDRRQEPLIDDIGELAVHICEALGTWNGSPYAFFGHSMGATVAFEVARRLRRRSATGPDWLFVSGRRAPSCRRAGDIHLRDDRGIIAELQQLGSTDSRILADAELLATILPVTRNDYRAIETYEYMPDLPLDCPITVLIGDADQQTSLEEALAWREHSTGFFDIQTFPGGHFYLDACKSNVADTISAALATISDSRDLDERMI